MFLKEIIQFINLSLKLLTEPETGCSFVLVLTRVIAGAFLTKFTFTG